jgi:hypothetical protein
MMIIRRLAVVLAAVGSLTAANAVLPVPAHAALSDCAPVGQNCFWAATDYAGTPYESGASGWPDGTCITLPASWRNVASSIYNRTAATSIRYYSGTSCSGTLLIVLFPGTARPELTGNLNNNIDSYKVTTFGSAA